MRKRIAVALVALAGVAGAVPSEATLLTFEGLGNGAQVGAFYAGAGITFSSTAVAFIDADTGGTGNFANEPSPNTAITILNGPSTFLDTSMGFMTLSLWHSARFTGAVRVFDGLGGSGNLLAFVFLPITPLGPGDPTGTGFATWRFTSLILPAFGRSVELSGTANQIGFDNVNVGLVPEPSTVALIGFGLVGLAVAARRRRAA